MSASKPWWEEATTDWTAGEPRRALDLFTEIYDERDSIKRVVKLAGLDWGDAPGSNASARAIWTWALSAASESGRVLDLAVEVLRDRNARDFHPLLVPLLGDRLAPVTLRLLGRYGAPSGGEDVSSAMLESLQQRGEEPAAKPVEGLQALTSPQAGFEPSWATHQAHADQMRRTAQIRRAGHAIGTGVLIGDDLLLTAAHVLYAKHWPPADADTVEVEAVFDYHSVSGTSLAEAGTPIRVVEYVCASLPTPAERAGKARYDWDAPKTNLDFAVVRLARPIGLEPVESPRGHYSVNKSPYGFKDAPLLRIVQHPLKMTQTTSFVRQPPEVNSSGTRIRYQANTERGSSGSPICDVKGRLVAIHHYSTETKNQAVPFQAIAEALLEGEHAAWFAAADALPAQPAAPAAAGHAVAFDPIAAEVIGGRPFVDRDPLRKRLRAMTQRNGSRFLAINGGRNSGKSHSYQLLSHVAEESGSCDELKKAAAGGLSAIQIDLRRYRNIPVKDRQAVVASALLERLGVTVPGDQPQDARMLITVESRLTRILGDMRAKKQQLWLFFDSLDDLAVARQDGVAEVLETVVGVAKDQQLPLRIVLAGREAGGVADTWKDMPYFDQDVAERLLDRHALDWVRARAKSRGRTITQKDAAVVEELRRLISQQLREGGATPEDIEAKLRDFKQRGLLAREVAHVLEKLMETVSEEKA